LLFSRGVSIEERGVSVYEHQKKTNKDPNSGKSSSISKLVTYMYRIRVRVGGVGLGVGIVVPLLYFHFNLCAVYKFSLQAVD